MKDVFFGRSMFLNSDRRTCLLQNAPNADHILKIINSHLYSFEIKSDTIEQIKSWLKGEDHAV